MPSYQEEARVIRATLLSAALQEYPELSVVLLIDDPQQPTSEHARRVLADARALPAELQASLDAPAAHFRARLHRFEAAVIGGQALTSEHLSDLGEDYRTAVEWLEDLAAAHKIHDHTDVFFTQHVVGGLARDLTSLATALEEASAEGAVLPAARLFQLHQRLVSTFSVRLTSFERKRYRSLSHEPNKAMNLNSYIGLMGGRYDETMTPLGRMLTTVTSGAAKLTVPASDFVLTLDADSVLLPEYALRMVHLLSQAENARVAVAQTPYSAFPGAATRLERISGASTDIQFIVHQGMTQYGATFWVGANAVLRKEALEDIVEIDYAGDVQIRRYIQDRTVIEDTESSIDLGVHGWRLHNYPERLAYSATPPDFGSLCIQRQRWANGGLLILSKLRRQMRARRQRGEQNRFGELFLRINYMASICWSSISLLVMLLYPFSAALLNPLLYLVSLPYFAAMAGDLRALGYRRLDVLRIYGFNLILLAVNLAGTAASLLQVITGEKSAFKRTPKVRDRTTAAPLFLLAPLVLIAYCGWTVAVDIRQENWVNLFFAATNATLAGYALLAYIGGGHLVVDLAVHLRDWVYRPVSGPKVRRRPLRRRATASAVIAARTVTWPDILGHSHPDVPSPSAAAEEASPANAPEPSSSGPRHRAAPTIASAHSGPELGLHSFDDHLFFTVFQPVIDVGTGEAMGYEALCRFADGLSVPTQLDTATQRGTVHELDAAMAAAALASAAQLPPAAVVFLNVAPTSWQAPEALVRAVTATRRTVVVETGHLDDAAAIAAARRMGVDFTLEADNFDGVLATLDRHRPKWLKLHRSIVVAVAESKASQQELVNVVARATEQGCSVIVCAVETEDELATLTNCGVRYVQGFHTGAPAPAAAHPMPQKPPTREVAAPPFQPHAGAGGLLQGS